MQNWYAAYMLLVNKKFNISLGKKNLKGEELLRRNVIDCIELQSLDTEKRVISALKFSPCLLNNISSLDLNFQESSQATFTCTFKYEQLDLINYPIIPNSDSPIK